MYSLFIAPFFTALAHAHTYAHAKSQYDSNNAIWVPSRINETIGVAMKVLAGLLLLATMAVFFAMRKDKYKIASVRTGQPVGGKQAASSRYDGYGYGSSEKDRKPQLACTGGEDVKVI
ncbi:hypothetical protein HBI81_195170 [Parastagonospora nodorum]|nr:hypothetical protein HBH53_199880 [Parastagonospora nodorum]KAH4016389.1 hypothetical protein HBI09_202540 [Parastagonospora nodorum]KAH4050027.1 hypothetical protein HBH49_141100 [Parastagonospora nodorum]KAH4195535.1 hypothetical protein HBI95_194500 [Parastagonospora nodorum]KAH4288692.1 hypothetical protein HBI02_208830 [Parastagonospora nodorum]